MIPNVNTEVNRAVDNESRAISTPEIRDTELQNITKSSYINEVAVLTGGDFRDLRIQSANESGFVIPEGSIAKDIFMSSTPNNIVDNSTKPAKGIEPSNQRMTNPDSFQTAGSFILSQRNESRAISTPEIRATNFSWRYSAVEKWKYSCGDMNVRNI